MMSMYAYTQQELHLLSVLQNADHTIKSFEKLALQFGAGSLEHNLWQAAVAVYNTAYAQLSSLREDVLGEAPRRIVSDV